MGRAMKRSRVFHCFTLLAWLLLSFPIPAQPEVKAQKRILVVSSLREGSPLSEISERALQKILNENFAGRSDYYREYIDVVRFPDPQYISALHDFLSRKYEHQTFDLIITVATAALDFVEQYGAQLFPGTPVVFLGGGTSSVEELRTRLECTGVYDIENLRPTLDLALRLQPGTSQVFVVNGTSNFDKHYERLLRSQIGGLEGRLKFNYLSASSMEEIQERVAVLPPGSIVYYLIFTEDTQGKKFFAQDSIRKIASAANAPVYIWFGGHMAQEVLGGSVMDIETMANQTMGMAMRVLQGERPENIPVIMADTPVNMLNWRQLRRWKISDDLLPSQRIIQFREPSLWEQHKNIIIGAIALFLIQTILIARLIVARRGQQVTRQELADRLRFQTILSDLSADVLGSRPADIDRKVSDWLNRLIEFLGVDRGVFLQFSDKGETIHRTYESAIPESQVAVNALNGDSPDKAPWYVEQLCRGVTLKSSKWLDELPTEAVHEKERGRVIGVKSHLAIPISSGGSVVAAIAFTTLKAYRKWPPDLVARLSLVGDIIAGALSRKYTDEELQGLTARLMQSQDDERRRIARELHDVTAQNLGTITMNLEGLLQDRYRPTDVMRILTESRTLGRESLNELRTLSYLLHPPMLEQAGLVFALEWYIDGFIRRSGIHVGLVAPPELNRLPPEVEIALFRVVQECLINIHRHSGSSTAEIRLEKRGGQVVIEVRDQGRGLRSSDRSTDGFATVGVGIPGMRQRLSQLGGSLEIETSGSGTTVIAVVPIEVGGECGSYSIGGRP